MAECNIDKCCFEDVKVCVKVNSVNGIKPNADGEVDIDESFVTTYSTQTIHGSKTFTNTIKTNGMNTEAMLTTMNGLKIDTAPTVINKSSIKWNDKEQNEVSSVEVSRPANTKDTCISLSANTITEWGSNEKASIEVHAKAGATSYATAPTPSSNATGNEIVTAEWVIDKGLADDTNVVHKTGNETINGVKSFGDLVYLHSNMSNKNSQMDLFTTPANTLYSQYTFVDKNGELCAYMQYGQQNTGTDFIGLFIHEKNKSLHGIMVTNSKELLPADNNTYNLGSSSYKWANAYITNTYTNKVTTCNITHPSDNSYFYMSGGSEWDKGANLFLYGSSLTGGNAGSFELVARNATETRILTGYPNGTLTWGGKNVALDDNVVHKSGNETINGIKTFTNVYSNEINTDIIGTKYIQHYDGGFLSTLTLPEHSGKVALQERTRANAEPVNRTLLYECAGGLDKGDITLGDMYSKYNALVIVYSNDDGNYMSTYYLDCAELDIRRNEAGSGTFLLIDGHSYWACTGASTGSKFVHATNNGLRIHKIYGLAEFY